MRQLNNNGKMAVEQEEVVSTKEEMAAFDRLPRWLRDIINDATFHIHCHRARESGVARHGPAIILEHLEIKTKENALACYGPDHPQAQ